MKFVLKMMNFVSKMMILMHGQVGRREGGPAGSPPAVLGQEDVSVQGASEMIVFIPKMMDCILKKESVFCSRTTRPQVVSSYEPGTRGQFCA